MHPNCTFILMCRSMTMIMNRQRSLDISESYYLLLELICTEPIIQQVC